jgi:hypothetical protein
MQLTVPVSQGTRGSDQLLGVVNAGHLNGIDKQPISSDSGFRNAKNLYAIQPPDSSRVAQALA